MMRTNSSIFIFLLVSVICTVNCYGTGKSPHCNKYGKEFVEGESITIPGQCKQATCTNAKINSVTELECPLLNLVTGCHLSKEDLSKPYPGCCPKPICPKYK